MRRALSLPLLSALILLAAPAPVTAQCPTNYAQVTAMQLGAATPLASGIMTVTATDASHDPINYSVPSIGTGLMKPWIVPVLNGAITRTLCLPRTDKTSTPVAYHFNVRDTSPQGGNRVVLDVYDVPITTNPWSLDNYSFLPPTSPYTLNVNPYTGTGLEELTGDVGAIGIGTANATVNAIHGTTVPLNSAADQVLLTTGIAQGSWGTLPNCPTDGLHFYTYSTTSHGFACTATAPLAASGVTAGSYNIGGQIVVVNATGEITQIGNPFSASFSCSQCGTYEIGYTGITSVSGTIGYGNPSTPTSAVVTDGTNTLTLTTPFTSWTFANTYTSNTCFALTAVGAGQTVTQQQCIAFAPRTFVGLGTGGATGVTASGTSAVLVGATGTLASVGLGNTTAGQTFTFNPAGQYIYLLLTGGCGHVLYFNGFPTTFTTLALTLVNQYSASVGGYCLYISPTSYTATGTIVEVHTL